MTKLLPPAEVPPLAIRPSDLKAAALRYAKALQDPEEAKVHAALVATPSVASQVVLVQILDYIDQRYWSSTDRIGQILAALRGAPDVKTVILEIDSPGGSVYGVHELAKQIRALRAEKKVVGIANSLAASAAYWIGSACSEFWVTPGGEVGSIGVWQMHMDVSKALEVEGVTVTLVSAGEHKVETNPFEPLSDEARAFMQQRIDEYHELFLKDVAEGRGVKVSDVRENFGKGRVFGAKQAVAAGMVDKIGTLAELLEKVGARRAAGSRALLERRQRLIESEGA